MTIQKQDELAAQWHMAKRHEDAARKERIAIEEKLLIFFAEPDTGEGTGTIKTDAFKIKASFGIRRSVLQEKVNDLFGDNQEENSILSLVFPTQFKLDLKQLRAVKAVNPNLYNKCAIAISAKPSKTSFKIDVIEEDKS